MILGGLPTAPRCFTPLPLGVVEHHGSSRPIPSPHLLPQPTRAQAALLPTRLFLPGPPPAPRVALTRLPLDVAARLQGCWDHVDGAPGFLNYSFNTVTVASLTSKIKLW